MSGFGFSILNSNGSVRMDSNTFGFMFVESFYAPPGTGVVVRSYPNLVGYTLKGLGGIGGCFSYPGGVPTVTLDTSLYYMNGPIYIFAI